MSTEPAGSIYDTRWWKDPTGQYVKCETCNQRNAIGVASVPGIPYSAAYCPECAAANAHPWWLLVANQAAIGDPFDTTADWWQDVVACTCVHLNRTLDQFKDAVRQAMFDDAAEMQKIIDDTTRSEYPPPKAP